MKLSILTAYYKTPELTKKLAEVLLPQLKDGVEWIIVNDGCDKKDLEGIDTKIIHLEENQGGAHAYNVALENAKGDYIALVDCDDLVSDNYVEVLVNAIDTFNKDLIFMNWKDMTFNIIYEHPTNIAGWKCIYRKAIFPKLDESILTTFDVPLHNEIMKDAYSKVYLNEVLYYYNSNRPGSITNSLVNKQ